MKLVPAPGFEPGTAAVRSGACKMIRYTLRAGFGKMVGHPGYAPGVSRSQAERISIFLVPDEKWRSRRVLPPLSPVRQTGESAVPLHDREDQGQESVPFTLRNGAVSR